MNVQLAEIDVGINRMTPVFQGGVHVGWEAACRHPYHQSPYPCRKNVRHTAKGRSEAQTVRNLQVWLSWGDQVNTRDDHMAMWGDIELADEIGSLPEGEIPPVMEFTGGHGHAPRKRRRGAS